jgi:hypothetical protein
MLFGRAVVMDAASMERLVESVAEVLDERFEELFAELVPAVAEELARIQARPRPSAVEELVDAKTVAKHLGKQPSWVYAHADELRARKLGTGPKPRLAFSLADVDAAISCTAGSRSDGVVSPVVERKRPGRRRRGSGTGVALLPIGGGQSGTRQARLPRVEGDAP